MLTKNHLWITFGFIIATAIGFIVWYSAFHLQYLYLRNTAALWMVAFAGLAIIFSIFRVTRATLIPLIPVIAWVLLSISSTFWSLSPSETVKTSMWHFIYLAAFAVGWRWSKQFLLLFLIVNAWIIFGGVDILLVLSEDFMKGVWFEKNVQGAQFILFLPLITALMLTKHKFAPLMGLIVGFCLFLLTLTAATAAQILTIIGIIAVASTQIKTWLSKDNIANVLGVLIFSAMGFLIGWYLITPEGVEVGTVGIGDTDSRPTSAVITSLQGRLFVIEDVGRKAIAALPLGVGSGTLRNIYSHLQTHPEVESVDAHMYYLQTLLELGILGLLLLITIFVMALINSWRYKRWGIFFSLFMFMGYLAFSVPAYYPAMMTLFFGLMGIANSPTNFQFASQGKYLPLWSLAPILCIPLFWLWWSSPCQNVDCALGRKLADRDTIRQIHSSLSIDEQLYLLEEAKERNPESLYFYRLYVNAYKKTGDDEGVLELYREIADKFPAADLDVYIDWREAARTLNNEEEAQKAYQASLHYFNKDFRPVNPILGPLYMNP